MESEKHPVLGGKAYVFKRKASPFWQCAASIDGHSLRTSTRESALESAVRIAEEWYFRMRGSAAAGILNQQQKPEQSFREAADVFLVEYRALTHAQRSDKWIDSHEIRLRLHILPFFGDATVGAAAAMAHQYRVSRMTASDKKNPGARDKRLPTGRVPALKTIHNEIITLRLVLKSAMRHGALASLPDLSPPYRGRSKVEHRAWFSPSDYKELYTATRQNAKEATADVRWHAEQLHDYILFLANTGLRPDEASNLLHRDIEIEEGEDGQPILVIEVRGKRGVGYCKSMPGAVRPYERLSQRPKPGKTESGRARLPERGDPVFPSDHRKMFNGILRDKNLKHDRDGRPRTAYSLRHSYICFRLMEGADIYQIAKNCRTSVEMIEKHYAAHIKNTLDATAINVRRPRRPAKESEEEK